MNPTIHFSRPNCHGRSFVFGVLKADGHIQKEIGKESFPTLLDSSYYKHGTEESILFVPVFFLSTVVHVCVLNKSEITPVGRERVSCLRKLIYWFHFSKRIKGLNIYKALQFSQ
jgi:hypothetical protein